ncbi:VTT domain-containing protein [Thalassobaculum sp.]|uniref:VTT domain-containing protein n=1 Tax=Thalassobaculum sp. TaxID=2022740 RepID=UPI0032EBA95E
MPNAEHPAAAPALNLERAAWRVARAGRARLLVDGAGYFGVLREVLKRARRRIVIVGWDIDSRTPLAADPSRVDDGLPLELGPFLAELARRTPDIEIRLLLWDYSMLYALEREPLPRLNLGWTSPPQITLCMDGTLPVGASHHQKLVVVDDAVAFCGGLDLTIRRWDTPDHVPGDHRRVDPAGQPYPPFHDLQMMVDGEAAAALAELARERWAAAAEVALAPIPAGDDPWPRDLEPDLLEVDVAIARTRPRYNGTPEIREGEATLRAAIAEAERFIYIENQYLTADALGEALIARMNERPDLEVLAVVPGNHDGWLEKNAMQAGRVRLIHRLREAGLAGRIRLVTPVVEHDGVAVPVKVHAKVLVVDDHCLRIGSSNLNNRSMGLDTECDLTLLARDGERRRILGRLRDALIAEHAGAAVEAIGEALAGPGSALAALERFAGVERRLVAVQDDPALGEAVPEPVATLADPDRPWPEVISFEGFRERRRVRRWIRRWPVAAVILAVAAMVLLWRYSPLEEWTRLDHLVEPMQAIASSPWAPLATVGLFLAGGLTLFPITVLIAVTAMVFGPWEGVLYSLIGSVAGALVGYGFGKLVARHAPSVWKVRQGRLGRLTRMFAGNGIIGIASLRMLPLAPFMFINLAAGAARVPFLDFAVGSALGLAPGIVAFNLMGVQFEQVLTRGRAEDIGVLVGLLAGWLLLSYLLQGLIKRTLGTIRERAG